MNAMHQFLEEMEVSEVMWFAVAKPLWLTPGTPAHASPGLCGSYAASASLPQGDGGGGGGGWWLPAAFRPATSPDRDFFK